MYKIIIFESLFSVTKEDADIDILFKYSELLDYMETSSENEKNIVMFNYIIVGSVDIEYNADFILTNEEIKFLCRMFDTHYLTFLANNLIEKRKKHEKN